MVLKTDQEKVMSLLKDTITLLCKNGLSFKSQFCVDAVIGVTVDSEELFYVSMNEVVKNDKAPIPGRDSSSHTSAEESADVENDPNGSRRRRRKKRKRRIKMEGPGGSDDENNYSLNQDNTDTSMPPEMDDSNSHSNADPLHPSAAKRPFIKKEIEEDEDQSDQDIVFIKQELDDNFPPCSQGSHVPGGSNNQFFDNSSMGSSSFQQSQDQNFSSLSDMNMQPGTSNNMWSMPQQQQRPYIPRGPRPSTMSSSSPGAGSSQQPQGQGVAGQPGMDQQQGRIHEEFMPSGAQENIGRSHTNLTFGRGSASSNLGYYKHVCNLCGKGYANKIDMEGHINTRHTNTRDFVCQLCGAAYAYKKLLQRHTRTKHH